MIYPDIDLEKITEQLHDVGFVTISKLRFRRGFIDIEIKDGIIPEGAEEMVTPFFRIKIYGYSNDVYLQFDCDKLDSFINTGE